MAGFKHGTTQKDIQGRFTWGTRTYMDENGKLTKDGKERLKRLEIKAQHDMEYGFRLGYAACMRENGATYTKIAEKLNISESSVRNMLKTYKNHVENI